MRSVASEPLWLVVFAGLIASGKSTLAEAFARARGCPSYNTDRVRKELAGLAATERRPDGLDQGIYSPEFSATTYQEMLKRAGADLTAGAACVVLDGSYQDRAERDRVRTLADRHGAGVVFVLCVCGEAETMRRLKERARDPNAVSDGRWEIYLGQRERFRPFSELDPSTLLTLDSEAPLERLLARLDQLPMAAGGATSHR